MEYIRSYFNKNNELISVTKEHLETAVELKIQLQEVSPSRKVNWHKHKRMMEQEGFFDSCKSESYRALITNYQDKIGKLVNYSKKSDIEEQVELESIKKEIGELYQQKQQSKEKTLQLNKLKKQLAQTNIVSENIRETFLDNFKIDIPKFLYKPKLETGNKKAILTLSDFHIGATVKNVQGNFYNYNVAKKRIDEVIKQTLEYCKIYHINDLRVVNLGDICEQLFMRNVNQAFECEFNFSEQIVKATELIIYALTSLSQHVNIEYAGIFGNHDRMNGQKSDNVMYDSTVVVVNYILELFINLSNIPRLVYVHTDEKFFDYKTKINGSMIKFVHGDNDTKKDKNKLSKHSQMDKEHYKALIMGHYHHFEVIERDFGGLEVYTGSLMGRNNYSKKLKTNTDPSQTLIVVHENGELSPFRIPLNHVQG